MKNYIKLPSFIPVGAMVLDLLGGKGPKKVGMARCGARQGQFSIWPLFCNERDLAQKNVFFLYFVFINIATIGGKIS
jgi:hypothetical protein